jgi:hypothetical protein
MSMLRTRLRVSSTKRLDSLARLTPTIANSCFMARDTMMTGRSFLHPFDVLSKIRQEWGGMHACNHAWRLRLQLDPFGNNASQPHAGRHRNGVPKQETSGALDGRPWEIWPRVPFGNHELMFSSRIDSSSHSTSKRTHDDSWTNLLPKHHTSELEAAVEERFNSDCCARVLHEEPSLAPP